jgi:hypothetical protein
MTNPTPDALERERLADECKRLAIFMRSSGGHGYEDLIVAIDALASIPAPESASPVAWISASELEKLRAGHAAFVTPGGGDGDTPLYGIGGGK